MSDSRTLWENLQAHYNHGVSEVEDFLRIWQAAKPLIDGQRWQETDERLHHQLENAREWRQVCLDYFRTFAEGTHPTK
jgi:alpha-glucuronidase